MAISYRFCKILEFSRIEGYYKPLQLTIEGTEEEAECKFKVSDTVDPFVIDERSLLLNSELLKKVENPSILKVPKQVTYIPYDAYIDIVINQAGKVYNKPFTRFLSPHQFNIYYLRELGYFLFADTQQDVVTEFVDSMNIDSNSGLKLEPIEVDFDTLRPLVDVITGIWFGDMKEQYLKSAGYFGRHVDRSNPVQEALRDKAKIRSLLFDYTYNFEDLTVSVTKSGSVILYSRIKDPKTKKPDIKSEISLVTQIFVNFILPGIKSSSDSK